MELMELTKVCPFCKREFKTSWKVKVYCSRKCKYTAKDERDGVEHRTVLSLECKQCSKPFESVYKEKLYCSGACKYTSQRRRAGVKEMPKRGWEPGKRFARLILVSQAPNAANGSVRWNVLCDCGNTSVARADKLSGERTKSCGCLQREVKQQCADTRERLKQQRQEIHARRLERQVQKQAHKTVRLGTPEGKHKSLGYALSFFKIPSTDPLWNLHYYTELIRDDECHYCKGPLDGGGHSLGCIKHDILMAYNVVPICRSCLTQSWHLTFDDLILLGPSLEVVRLNKEQRLAKQQAEEKELERQINFSKEQL